MSVSTTCHCSSVRSIATVARSLFFIPLENEAGVVSAEAHGVRHRDVYPGPAGLIGDVVQVTLGVRMVQVYGRGNDAGLDRHDGDNRLYRARGSQCVPCHGLGRADSQLVRMLTETGLDRLRLGAVV